MSTGDRQLVIGDWPGARRFRARMPVLAALLLALSTAALCQTISARGPGAVANSSAGSTMAVEHDRRAATPRGEDMVIGPDDLLRVEVFDVPQLSGDLRVDARGAIRLPLMAAPIRAAGSTADELGRAIAAGLRSQGLVSNPRVTVEIKRSLRYSVVIGGAVHKPQICPLAGRMSLLELLAQAQGLADDAGEYAIITRAPFPANGGVREPAATGDAQTQTREIVDLKKLMESRAPVYVYPGDCVTVERAGVVYVTGAVNRAGGFELNASRSSMTVLKAIALAEGLKSTAVRNRAFIIRQDSRTAQSRQEVAVNLREILAGRAPDLPMQPSDILFIPDSTSQKALRRAAEAAVDITTGVIIFRR